MLIRGIRSRAGCALLALLSCTPAPTPLERPTAVASASAAPAAAPVCVASENDAANRAFLRDFLGDGVVLKFASNFDDARVVAAGATARGATAAEPFIVEPGWMDAGGRSRPILIGGWGDPRRLAKYAIAGTLDALGEDDVAIPRPIAQQLDLHLGSRVTFFESAPRTLSAAPEVSKKEMRVASILDFPGEPLHGEGGRFAVMSLAAARTLAHGEAEETATGVRFWLPGEGDASAFERVSTSLDSTFYRVIEREQLVSPGYDECLEAARAACELPAGVPPASRLPGRFRPICDVARDREVGLAAARAIAGDYRIVTTDSARAASAARSAGAVRTADALAAGGDLTTADAVEFVTFDAIEAGGEALFTEHVARGDLRASLDRGDLVLSDDLATELGVDVGAEVAARVRRPQDGGPYVPWRAKVGVIVALPGEETFGLGADRVWISGAKLRDLLGLPAGSDNIVLASRDDDADAGLFESNLIARLGTAEGTSWEPAVESSQVTLREQLLAGACPSR